MNELNDLTYDQQGPFKVFMWRFLWFSLTRLYCLSLQAVRVWHFIRRIMSGAVELLKAMLMIHYVMYSSN